jgi:hypothetical protein
MLLVFRVFRYAQRGDRPSLRQRPLLLHEQTYLTAIAKDQHIMTLSLLETGSGVHFYLPETAVKRVDDGYRVTGTKQWFTRFYVQYRRVGEFPRERPRGLACPGAIQLCAVGNRIGGDCVKESCGASQG